MKTNYTQGVAQLQPRVTPWDKTPLPQDSKPEGVGNVRRTLSGLEGSHLTPYPGCYPELELSNAFGVRKLILALTAISLLIFSGSTAFALSTEADVRSVVEQVFQNLKDKNYEALYDTLPAGTRARVSRERFASALRRTQDSYALNRMEVGKVSVSGNIAVVNTVLYGRLLQPFDTEGKIVVQQYLVREDGKWKVATGDNATVNRFLAANPAFARQFRIRPPRVFVKKDGTWVEFTPPKRQRQG